MPYKCFLGLSSVASAWSIATNFRQAYILSTDGIELIEDELSRAAEKYAREHKRELTSHATSNTFTNMLKRFSGGEDDNNMEQGGVGVPEWLKTYSRRLKDEKELSGCKAEFDRALSLLCVILIEDLPFFFMNFDLISQAGILGCDDDETRNMKFTFVLFTFLSSIWMGVKMHKISAIPGKYGLNSKIVELEGKIRFTTVKGNKELVAWELTGKNVVVIVGEGSNGEVLATLRKLTPAAAAVVPVS